MTQDRPNDRRGFVHKRLLSAVGGFIGGGPLGAIAGFAGGGARRTQRARTPSEVFISQLPVRRTPPRELTARPSARGAMAKQQGRVAKLGNGNGTALATFGSRGGPCRLPGQKVDPCTGECDWFIGTKPGRDDEPCPPGSRFPGQFPAGRAGPVGEAVMGQYGAGLVPGSMMIDRAVCLRGMQLGNDGVCYNKGAISNKQRMWPAGRRPLLTGGDMRAISIAARAGSRLERTTKRLQKIGLMKRPPTQRKAPGKAMVVKEAGAGSVTIQ